MRALTVPGVLCRRRHIHVNRMADVRCATEVVSSLLNYLGIVGTTQTFCVDAATDFGANPVDKLGIFAQPIREFYICAVGALGGASQVDN